MATKFWFMASYDDNLAGCKAALAADPNINVSWNNPRAYMKSPLHEVASNNAKRSNGRLPMLKLLIGHNADVNNAKMESGKTPLMEASLSGYVDVLKELLAAGADKTLKNKV